MKTSVKSLPAAEFLNRKPRQPDRQLAELEAQIAELEARVDAALDCCEPGPMDGPGEAASKTPPPKPASITIWGVPFSYLTLGDTLRQVDRLIEWGRPTYFITANLNYNMLTERHPELRLVNDNAAFIVCDGIPMVWYSRWLGKPLPERVAGSELIYALTKWASRKGHRIYFLGGAPGVAQSAADRLSQRYPGLQVAGVEAPPFRPLSAAEEGDLIARIREAKPDIVYVALGQPKGELWIARNCERIGAPLCVQLGASFDFVAGGVARAPRWLQRAGLEWFHRMCQEPQRLTGRYCRNGLFLLRSLLRQTTAW